MEFFEAPAFTRYVSSYLNDDAYRELQIHLARTPAAGDLMPGTGGFRKIRWADSKRSKGRRGGLRVIYYFPGDHQVWLMTIYDKNETSDLTPKQKQALKGAIDVEIRARQLARVARQRKAGR